MNVVVLGQPGAEPKFVEVQGTAEGAAFSQSELDSMLGLATKGLAEIIDLQALLVSEPPPASAGAMSSLPQLVSATANPHKLAEIAGILDGLVELFPRPAHIAEVVEDAGTLEGNARLKAAAICAATGLPGQRRHRAVRRRWAANPASTPYFTPAHTPPMPRTERSCWRCCQVLPIVEPASARS